MDDMTYTDPQRRYLETHDLCQELDDCASDLVERDWTEGSGYRPVSWMKLRLQDGALGEAAEEIERDYARELTKAGASVEEASASARSVEFLPLILGQGAESIFLERAEEWQDELY